MTLLIARGGDGVVILGTGNRFLNAVSEYNWAAILSHIECQGNSVFYQQSLISLRTDIGSSKPVIIVDWDCPRYE
jgi:hypothetical protein